MSLWARWRALQQSPIYKREKGDWGQPNPFYSSLSRYSPFVVIGAILLGACTGFSNPALFTGGETFIPVWCLVCVPAMLLGALTLFGTIMAPTLTAPSISLEIDKGTWDILRATPMPARSILMAKLFGALARLRIWPLLFTLSLLQGLIIGCGVTAVSAELMLVGWLLGIAAIIRPWLEILFAAFMGMYLSTMVRSATTALAGSYVAVLLVRVFNSSITWTTVAGVIWGGEEIIFALAGLGPAVAYALMTAALWLGIMYQADRL